jgi:hypothetical protein
MTSLVLAVRPIVHLAAWTGMARAEPDVFR